MVPLEDACEARLILAHASAANSISGFSILSGCPFDVGTPAPGHLHVGLGDSNVALHADPEACRATRKRIICDQCTRTAMHARGGECGKQRRNRVPAESTHSRWSRTRLRVAWRHYPGRPFPPLSQCPPPTLLSRRKVQKVLSMRLLTLMLSQLCLLSGLAGAVAFAGPYTVGMGLRRQHCVRLLPGRALVQRGRRPQVALRLYASGAGAGDDVERRIAEALAGRAVPGSAGRQNMPMSRSERRAYEKLGEALMDAVREEDADAVQRLCTDEGADPAFADEFGFSCLHLAAKRGYLEVVRALVQQGADINQEGEGATVPLHMAAQFGHEALVQAMLELGADVDHKDSSGSTPLRLAQMYGRKAVEDLLRPLVDTGKCTRSTMHPG